MCCEPQIIMTLNTPTTNVAPGLLPRPGYVLVKALLQKTALIQVNALMGKANAESVNLGGTFYEPGTLVYLNFYGAGSLEGNIGQPFSLVFRGTLEFRIVPSGTPIPLNQRGDFLPLLLAIQQA